MGVLARLGQFCRTPWSLGMSLSSPCPCPLRMVAVLIVWNSNIPVSFILMLQIMPKSEISWSCISVIVQIISITSKTEFLGLWVFKNLSYNKKSIIVNTVCSGRYLLLHSSNNRHTLPGQVALQLWGREHGSWTNGNRPILRPPIEAQLGVHPISFLSAALYLLNPFKILKKCIFQLNTLLHALENKCTTT